MRGSNLFTAFKRKFVGISSRSSVQLAGKMAQANSSRNLGFTIRGDYPVLIGKDSLFEEAVCLDATRGEIKIGKGCKVSHHAHLIASEPGLFIGESTEIGPDVLLDCAGGELSIGEQCRIGAHVSIRGQGKGTKVASGCTIGFGSIFDSMGGEISIGSRTQFLSNCIVVGTGRGIRVESDCEFHYGVVLDSQGGSIEIGQSSGAGPYAIIYGHGGIEIGQYCAIAGQTVLIPANHRFDRTDIPIRKQGSSGAGIRIADDVWIGTQCVVLDGSHIGKGCVVAAGSVVRDVLPDYSVVGGVPCRIMKTRLNVDH